MAGATRGAVTMHNVLRELDKDFMSLEELRQVNEAVNAAWKRRRATEGAEKRAEFRTGQNVVFNGNVAPKYLIGLRAKVVSKTPTKVVVKILDGTPRFPKGVEVRVFPQCLDAAGYRNAK